RPIFIFLFGYFVVFFQAYIDLLLGNISPNDTFFFVVPDVINRGAALNTVGLVMLLIGYSFRQSPRILRPHFQKSIPIVYLVILLTFFNVLQVYLNINVLLSGEYSQEQLENSAGTAGSYANLLFYVTYLAVIICHTLNCRRRESCTLWGFFRGLGLLF